MARTTIEVAAPIHDAWRALQRLSTWEGVAGIGDLHDPTHDADGDLSSFCFAMDTPVGRVAGRADVRAESPRMQVLATEKGLRITLTVELSSRNGGSTATVEARADSTSFLSKPLALTVGAVLESSIEEEAAKIASRIT